MPKIANPKTIQNKSRSHKVAEVVPYRKYRVISGESGDAYMVTFWARSKDTIAASCTCKWGKYHRNSACSHVLAAVDNLFPEYTPSAWTDFENAQRQHRKQKYLDNVIITLRKK
jgi:hypothetical protein